LDPRDPVDEVHRRDEGADAGGHVRVLPVRLPRDHRRDDLARHRLLGVALEVIERALRLPEVLIRLEARLRRLLAELVHALLVVMLEEPAEVLDDVLAIGERLGRPLERRPEGVGAVDRVTAVVLARARDLEERDPPVGERGAGDELRGAAPDAVDEVQTDDGRVARLARDGTAEEVRPQHLAGVVIHLEREERVTRAALGVERADRIGSAPRALAPATISQTSTTRKGAPPGWVARRRGSATL